MLEQLGPTGHYWPCPMDLLVVNPGKFRESQKAFIWLRVFLTLCIMFPLLNIRSPGKLRTSESWPQLFSGSVPGVPAPTSMGLAAPMEVQAETSLRSRPMEAPGAQRRVRAGGELCDRLFRVHLGEGHLVGSWLS